MLTRLSLIILIFLHTASACYGLEVVAVKSSPAQPYEEALQAFSRHLASLYPVHGTKSIQPDITITPLIVGSDGKPEALRLAISNKKPDLIVALGSKALQITAPIKNIPIIYLLVPLPEKIAGKQANITGVLLEIDPGAQFRALNKILPSVKRVGVLYDPEKTGALVTGAADSGNTLIFVLRPTRSPQDVVSQLASLQGEIDLLWMLPDSTILSPQTEKSFYRFALQNKVPILAFTEKYLSKGASFASHLDLDEMGRLAALLALRIQNGESIQGLPPLRPDRVVLKINHTMTDKLGLKIQEIQP
jgi:putative ABC transport system substrate-binding protein